MSLNQLVVLNIRNLPTFAKCGASIASVLLVVSLGLPKPGTAQKDKRMRTHDDRCDGMPTAERDIFGGASCWRLLALMMLSNVYQRATAPVLPGGRGLQKERNLYIQCVVPPSQL